MSVCVTSVALRSAAFSTFLALGCSPSSAAPPAKAAPTSEATRETGVEPKRPVACEGPDETTEPSLAESEVISPRRRVPEFHVATTDCAQLDSDELVGKRAFVLVFFSSWCGVCEKKLPLVQAAREKLGPGIPFYGVVLDNEDTWSDVDPYVERLGLELPLVRGARFRRFALGYNPYQGVPVVVVIGRNGYVVDLQIGYSPYDYTRLLGAAELAMKIPADFEPPAVVGGKPEPPSNADISPEEESNRMPESAAERGPQ